MNAMPELPPASKPRLLFLFPLVYRPEKPNVAGQFSLLSRWYQGHIFSLSGSKLRNVPVSGFLFHSDKLGSGAASRLLAGLWIQVIVPLRMLWGGPRVGAVVAYDPYRSGIAALILKYALRCKMIVELNGDYHRAEPGRNVVTRFLMRSFLNLVVRCADAVRVLNNDQEAYCRRHYPHARIYRFSAFVATDYFESLDSTQGDYLLSVGYPFDLKGMDVLIVAFRMIADKHPKTSLRIMGWCPPKDHEKYQALAAGHPRITFLEPGWIEDVGKQMRDCYALVNAARSEAMGRIHVEAMACAKPIVATRTNGALECIEDGKTGLLCAIGDSRDLAGKLDELLSDPHRAAQMGRSALERMRERFSERECVAGYHSMFKDVTGFVATLNSRAKS